MTYSCSDFTDDIVSALHIDTDKLGEPDCEVQPSDLADAALAEIQRLQKFEAALNGKNLDHIIAALVLMQDIDAENGRESDAKESADLIELLQRLDKPADVVSDGGDSPTWSA
jgi:hypothetical protein